ncbi:hypothetical protein CTAYLR_001663, partial [Chrysophaeum taylorii]
MVPRDRVRSRNKGGTLFVDEAYQLEPKTNQIGRQVLDYLLAEMEDKRGKLVVVFAGYAKPLEALLEHNEGLPSRFRRRFDFPDFTDDELTSIMRAQLDEKSRYRVEDAKHVRIAARRLGRQRSTTGFGNARAVRNYLELVFERQSQRVVRENENGRAPDKFALIRSDFLGPRTVTFEQSEALKELWDLIGLDKVKASVASNAEREENEMELQEDLGLLSKGEVVLKNPSDFIGSALGQSEERTNAILEKSQGCVLVIDEAYGLNPLSGDSSVGSTPCPYKSAVVDTLVARVQGVPGEDRCVLLLGYKRQMEDFVRRANPGLARRFQTGQAFQFDDYDDEALLKLVLRAVESRGRRISFEVARTAVNNLVAAAIAKAEDRLRDLPPSRRALETELVLKDFYEEPEYVRNPESIFEGLIGCDAVRDKLREYRNAQRCDLLRNVVQAARSQGRDPLDDLELVFAFTGYVGQAAGKTRQKFEEARGGVLFIDEAYRLCENGHQAGYMKEAVDEIVQILTEDDFKGKMVVIFAGYEHEIKRMLDSVNPGLKSRVSQTLKFPPFDARAATALLEILLENKRIEVAPGVASELPSLARVLVDAPQWASGRDVTTWAQRVSRKCAQRNSFQATADICRSAMES